MAAARRTIPRLIGAHSSILQFLIIMYKKTVIIMYTREKLLVSHRAPPQVADRGTLTRYGGYRGNKIPGVDQN